MYQNIVPGVTNRNFGKLQYLARQCSRLSAAWRPVG
jgi:hypothetical protein